MSIAQWISLGELAASRAHRVASVARLTASSPRSDATVHGRPRAARAAAILTRVLIGFAAGFAAFVVLGEVVSNARRGVPFYTDTLRLAPAAAIGIAVAVLLARRRLR